MAYSDYRLCDVCGDKTFYDADLNYDYESVEKSATGVILEYLGQWVVICNSCTSTHDVLLVRRRDGEICTPWTKNIGGTVKVTP